MVMAFMLMFFNVIFVKDENTYRGITFLFLFIFGFLIYNQLYGKLEVERAGPRRKMLLYSELEGKTVLVKYSPLSEYEQVVVDMVEYFVDKTPVLLVSTMPRSSWYLEGFEDEVSRGKIRLIEVTTTGTRSLDSTPIRFPLSELEWLKEVYTASPEGSAVIFEPLSDVIMNMGSVPTYKLLRYWIEMCSDRDMSFIAFMNHTSHHKEVVSAFEGLFFTVAVVEDRKLVKVR
jgi:hypothetical protein